MTTFALIRNATGTIEEYRQEAADWSAPAHKFGPDHPTRWVPVVDLPVPAHDPATQAVVPASAVLNGDVVERGWSVIQKPGPEAVQLYSLRAVFALHGLTSKIDAAIAALPEPQKSIAFAHWNYGNTISRQHPLVLSLISLLGLSETEADEIFRDAQTVEQGGTPDVKPEEVSMWQRLLNLFS